MINNKARLKNLNGTFWKKPKFEKTQNNTYVIPNHAVGRPDTISEEIYNVSDYDWVIMMYNDISDPFKQLTSGKILFYPSIEEIRTLFADEVT